MIECNKKLLGDFFLLLLLISNLLISLTQSLNANSFEFISRKNRNQNWMRLANKFKRLALGFERGIYDRLWCAAIPWRIEENIKTGSPSERLLGWPKRPHMWDAFNKKRQKRNKNSSFLKNNAALFSFTKEFFKHKHRINQKLFWQSQRRRDTTSKTSRLLSMINARLQSIMCSLKCALWRCCEN